MTVSRSLPLSLARTFGLSQKRGSEVHGTADFRAFHGAMTSVLIASWLSRQCCRCDSGGVVASVSRAALGASDHTAVSAKVIEPCPWGRALPGLAGSCRPGVVCQPLHCGEAVGSPDTGATGSWQSHCVHQDLTGGLCTNTGCTRQRDSSEVCASHHNRCRYWFLDIRVR